MLPARRGAFVRPQGFPLWYGRVSPFSWSAQMKYIIIACILMAVPTVTLAECVQTPRSSWISEICYDNTKVTATMRGVKYDFCGVPRSVFDKWVAASSVGSFYNQWIRDRYSC